MVQADCLAADALDAIEKVSDDDDAAGTIARFLANGDVNVRSAAAAKLVEMGSVGASQAAFVSEFFSHADPAIRGESLSLLLELLANRVCTDADLAFVDRVVSLLHDSQPHLRAVAAEALPRIGSLGVDHVDMLASLLSDQDASTRAAAVDALGKLGAEAHAGAVARLARDKDWQVRGAVAKALAQLGKGDGAHLQTLAELLGDPVGCVGEQAATALDSLGSAGRSRPCGDLQEEVQVQTAWASLLDHTPPTPVVTQVGDHEVWVVDNLFSRRECAALLAVSEGHGFGTTDYDQEYRGNLRLMTMDKSLSSALWRRLQPLVPDHFAGSCSTWNACGLNECFRLSKYHPKTRFEKHCDGSFKRKDEMSMITVNAYLNDGFEGGSTRFYFEDGEPGFILKPKAGSCLLFSQPPRRYYIHDGEEVVSGFKYLLRSDVMYRKVSASGKKNRR